MYALQAIETLNKVNAMSIDPEISILHHRVFHHANRKYTHNIDYIDHEDGSITGYLLGMDRNGYVVSREGFKIEPDGDIQKGIMRNFAIKVKIIKEK